ncbi:hypothetical protein ACIA5G_39785 [Amycolatopsis sp. NPDC051758]|uniref:hypothetical protein n=1 Tax=Amycolatopsis sp. NPDC051758 TaxID=3363935 RepID=UPI0037B43209
MDRGDPNGTFFEKLRYLRFTHRGLNNQIYTYAQIAEHVTRVTGRRCGEGTIERLFTPGATTKYPSEERLAAILSLFGRTPDELEARGDPSGTFGQRVAHQRYLFAQRNRAGKPPSLEEIASYIRGRTGRSCSASYVSQLLCDRVPYGPARDKIEALASFFDVSPAFFFGDEQSQAVMGNELLLRGMRDFIDALYDLAQIRREGVADVFDHDRPMHLDEFSELTERVRSSIAEVRAERLLSTPSEQVMPG